ncbi:MAG TPA: ABC transporter substrate-binding protein [Burkholderiaceae bacterium]|nr:ABC transporter substrate-binding protein [Burkholderiaceae bacterium]
MKLKDVLAAAGAAALVGAAACASAQEPLKIGAVLEVTGPFASIAKQIENGMRLYIARNGDTVAGRKVELIIKDSTGAQPDVAKRLVTELVTRDKVDFVVGFGLTPNAMAAAPVVTEAKVPTIIMNAATSVIVSKSPYMARVSMTLPQVTMPIAQWAIKNNIKKVYSLVADYGPGLDAEATFKKNFTAGGGEIVGEVRTPLKNPDFGPFIQRIKDAKPEAVFIFLPAGEQGISFMKGYRERGLAEAGIRLIGPGDVVEDDILEAIGDSALGVVTTHHYSAAHDSPLNREYVKAYMERFKIRPNFMSVGGYDGMAVVYEVARKLNGKIDADKAMEVIKGMKIDSPRGPIQIDPVTRDVVQTVYVRKVEKKDGKLFNIEFDKFENVRDPGT